ncbi:Mitochondrial ATPase complex subunit atp10 [Tulasnella sp. 424]|nr:Mitochondrial ATPase complex subunit atp10 [Tulasnella sp. 424]KAG8965730.1 Mitochondrial ATPase complex subunit atp10 [Tulasnella sp. 425]
MIPRSVARIQAGRLSSRSFTSIRSSNALNLSTAASFSRTSQKSPQLAVTPSPVFSRSLASKPSSSPPGSSKSSPEPGVSEEDGPSLAPLPILPRALGVPKPPTAEARSWQEKKEEMLDRDKHLEKRKFLIKQATSGYFEDFHKTMHGGHGGKMWMAPKVLIREDKSLYFPDVAGKNLLGDQVHTTTLCKGNISVVAFLSTQAAEEHVKSFTKFVLAAYTSDPKFKFINLQENILKSAIVSLSKSSIKRTIPQEFHETYMHSSQNMEMLRKPLGFENKHLGFVYLVDENLKIRWAGCGYAKDEEGVYLMELTNKLLQRLQSEGESKKDAAGEIGKEKS